MQVFHCPECNAQVWFDNLVCPQGHTLHFDPDSQRMVPAADCNWRAQIGCNWAADPSGDGYCRSCAMTRTVPDLALEDNLRDLAATEAAKRWVLAGLHRWGWFGFADGGGKPVFDLVAEQTSDGPAQITMGHANGVITINVAEASRAVREARREDMSERYRTMIGHMRHELAHFLFVRLAEDPQFLQDFRALFGDETQDYGAALQSHYENPGQAGPDFITSYATAHPHEDWAETVAHLLHLTDLADSGCAVGLLDGQDPYAEPSTKELIHRAADFAMRVNHVNRALDLPDLYPFVLGEGVREKLTLAHGSLRRAGQV
ncbi:zinc-binding metallopeptidase family protein [Psychromarinibacter halotolerans]|uniref:Zinc-binding metallopeptidase n=1 Tax=Psychromarinibacter halotolerans TaxID=1775175 RepID=A0ABV7GTX7_9RHOB|nr:putative zinc-binding metallopeptidase [Psychromarinibacter halotolerans]MDF0598109.1 putative zinc-binding metallopeptidase [Psychromarinibacter halotolerans]